MLTGTAVYAGLLATGHPDPWNFHAGVVALLLNVAICLVVTRLGPPESTRSVGAPAPA